MMNIIIRILSRKWYVVSATAILIWCLLIFTEGISRVTHLKNQKAHIHILEEKIRLADESDDIIARMNRQRQEIISNYSALYDGLPNTDHLSVILKEFQKHLNNAIVVLEGLTPSEILLFDTHRELPFDINVKGSYHSVGALVQALENSDHLIHLNGVRLSSDGLLPETIQADLSVTVIVLNEVPDLGD